jgi:hypothetical protein
MAPAFSLSSRAPFACLSERDVSAIGLYRSEGQFDLFESRLYIGFYVLRSFEISSSMGYWAFPCHDL